MSQSPQTISSLLKREIKPVILLGAGASARSGILVTNDLVSEIAKWGYCKSHGRDANDPTLMRSDWWPWLVKQAWFRSHVPLSDNYPKAVEAILKPREDRKAFLQQVLNPGVQISSGYQVLAELLARRVIRTVLTTNFDSLLAQQCRSIAAIHEITEIRTPDDFRLFSTNPAYPQIVYLHGSVDHYTDQNLERETQRLNDSLVDLLRPLLRDHPLIVIGYRGAEPSVMKHLLSEQAGSCANFKHGIYWCHRKGDIPLTESPLVAELSAAIGGNLELIEIDGFDELMEQIDRDLPELLAAPLPAEREKSVVDALRSGVHDLQPSDLDIRSLDQSLVRAKLLAYCEAVRLPKPPLGTEAELVSAMEERHLAGRHLSGSKITNGGRLLFARAPDVLPAGAKIEVRILGPRMWVDEVLERPESRTSAGDVHVEESVTLEGNLWSQMDQGLTLLSRANRRFRLKGTPSIDVYPFSPLALKEVLTNLLAHRDYSASTTSSIEIRREKIVFQNPGGLIDHVRRQLHSRDLQSAIESSARGIKGYRNPVIADFFFSAGAMDKEGSGLPDVVSESANNLNEVKFGPIDENRGFQVQISVRPEYLAVDPETRTARSTQGELRYSPNLLPVLTWPSYVWKMATIASYREFSMAREGGAPPFCLHRDWIWTFAEPGSSHAGSLVALAIPEEIHRVPLSELTNDAGSTFALPRLLNSALEQHLKDLGLRVRFEGNRLRAYFPAEGGVRREVTYKGRFKEATRTVSKPIVSRTTGQTVFWEHKAAALRFERFANVWSLAILPSYVFTRDGDETPIESERIGPLTTKRAARDYNPTVLHDLVFWSRILSRQTQDSSFRISLTAAVSDELSEAETSLELVSIVPTIVFQEPVEAATSAAIPDEAAEFDMLEIQDEIESIIDTSDSDPHSEPPVRP